MSACVTLGSPFRGYRFPPEARQANSHVFASCFPIRPDAQLVNALIRMPELKRCFEAHGFGNVATYIQSRNVLLEPSRGWLPDQTRSEHKLAWRSVKMSESVGCRALRSPGARFTLHW